MVRLTESELSTVDRYRANASRAAWIREAALDALESGSHGGLIQVPSINRECWRELARLHSNLTQLMRAFNSDDGQLMDVLGYEGLESILVIVRDLYSEVSGLRQELLGAGQSSVGAQQYEGEDTAER